MSQLEEMTDQPAYCPQCGTPLSQGRVDRRFCSVRCKNLWHNRRRFPDKDREIRKVLRILDNNREVLEKLIKMGVNSIDRVTLAHLGCNLNYFTSLDRQRHRWVYTCLDIRYEMTPTRVRNLEFLWEGVDVED